jgi:hypothetical protein
MSKSKSIALCGVSAALGSLFLYILVIAPTGKLSLLALSSAALMIPVSKKLYGGAVLTMLATAAIGFFAGGFVVLLPYITVFGIHPLINAIFSRINIFKNKYADVLIKTAVKLIYFNLALYILYRFACIMELFAVNINFLLLAVIVSLAFIPYDFLMQALQLRIKYLIDKYVK